MVSVGIDVSKDKHDCFIFNSEGEVLTEVFIIPNNMEGFTTLLRRIQDCTTRLIRKLDAEIRDIETTIQDIMDGLHSPITTILGIGCRMGP